MGGIKRQSKNDIYSNPLLERYASKEMSHVFSPDFKFSTWRKLWVALAECESELGLPITREQVNEMKEHLTDIDYGAARNYEATTRHDVMAHILAYGDRCPAAKPIIHLGATSAFVGDNTDLIQMKGAAIILLRRLSAVIFALKKFALKNKDLATLGFTHFQPAQLTTVGKRASLWLYEMVMDYTALEQYCASLPFLGVKGTTGTQASYMSLFEGDAAKVKKLDIMVAKKMGFDMTVPVSGQTYSRKIDASALAIVSGIAQSFHKISNDIRLLMHLREIEEPFESGQVGSSAMAYKRNPMRCERATGLARYLMDVAVSPLHTAAEQWLERTLDDSSNKRIALPEAFLAADSILKIILNVAGGLVVYEGAVAAHVAAELPFMATEEILMAGVQAGGDRQDLHERIRHHSHDAARRVKREGGTNDLLDLLEADPAFAKVNIAAELAPARFIGRAPEQVDEFLAEHVRPILRAHRGRIAAEAKINV